MLGNMCWIKVENICWRWMVNNYWYNERQLHVCYTDETLIMQALLPGV